MTTTGNTKDNNKAFIKTFVARLTNGTLFSLYRPKTPWKNCDLSERERSIIHEAIRLCHFHAATSENETRRRYEFLQNKFEQTVCVSGDQNKCNTEIPPEEQIFWMHAAQVMLSAYSKMPPHHSRMKNWEKAVLRKMSREQQSALQAMPSYQTFAEKATYLSPIFESLLKYKKDFDGTENENNPSSRIDTMRNIEGQIKARVKDKV